MDALRDNPIPTLLVVIAAVAGAVVLIMAAARGQADAGGLTFEGYFKTLIAGAVALGAVRVAGQGLAARQGRQDPGKV